MDDIVLQAMARWPNVPSVYGWLSLDRRGRWRIKGEVISNSEFVSYIGRNYERDPNGRWYFQNGPQRVFVQLAYLPAVVHLEMTACEHPSFITHTGLRIEAPDGVWLDEAGSLMLQYGDVAALILDRDLERTLELVENSHRACASALQVEAFLEGRGELYFTYRGTRRPLRRIHSSDAPRRFGFIPDPRPAPGEPEC